jgi:hypothetical protein
MKVLTFGEGVLYFHHPFQDHGEAAVVLENPREGAELDGIHFQNLSAWIS